MLHTPRLAVLRYRLCPSRDPTGRSVLRDSSLQANVRRRRERSHELISLRIRGTDAKRTIRRDVAED